MPLRVVYLFCPVARNYWLINALPYTVPMREYHFQIALSAERYLAHYQGVVRGIVVTLVDGTRLEFPAENLRPFVSREGVYGQFVLRVDANNKLQSLRRMGD